MLLVAALFVASTVAVGPDTAVAAEEPSDDNLDSFVNYWVLSNKLASLQQQVCHTTTVRVPTRMQLSQPPSMQQQTREQAGTDSVLVQLLQPPPAIQPRTNTVAHIHNYKAVLDGQLVISIGPRTNAVSTIPTPDAGRCTQDCPAHKHRFEQDKPNWLACQAMGRLLCERRICSRSTATTNSCSKWMPATMIGHKLEMLSNSLSRVRELGQVAWR
jgi:hypothetical protein